MNSLLSFSRMFLFLSITVCIYSQNNPPHINLNPSSPKDNPESIWDVQLNVNVTGTGAVWDGTFFYVTDRFSNLIRAYDVNGNLLNTFTIPGISGLGDITFDGTYEYGGTAGQTIFQMDFQTQTLVGTISVPVTVRFIAYDSDNDAFWVGTWNEPLTLVTRNGTVLATITAQFPFISGCAYDSESPGGPYLWLFGGNTPDSIMIYQIKVSNGTFTGVTHNVSNDIGVGVTNPASGGLFFMNEFIPNTASLGGILTGSPTKLFAYEIYNAVPVELTGFTAKFSDGSVQLNWITATETNNLGFEVQRAAAGNQISELTGWEKIGFVGGSGTTTETKTYSYTDKNVTTGTYSYRLMQIDFNGSSNYLEVLSINVNNVPDYILLQNYPNPFNPVTKIKYSIPVSGLVTLKVYDLLGREVAVLINEEKAAGSFEAEFDGSSVPSGVYLYRIQTGDYTAVRKMLLVK